MEEIGSCGETAALPSVSVGGSWEASEVVAVVELGPLWLDRVVDGDPAAVLRLLAAVLLVLLVLGIGNQLFVERATNETKKLPCRTAERKKSCLAE